MRLEAFLHRDALLPEVRDSKNLTICGAVEHAAVSTFSSPTIAVYEAMRSEVNLKTLIESAYQHAWRVCFPIMIQNDSNDKSFATMQFFHIPQDQYQRVREEILVHPLRKHCFAQLSECGYEHIEPAQLDVVVVPIVGFDAQGNRLGYGGGNYDRLIPDLRADALIVGVAFAEQQFSTLPSEPHDRRLARIISA